MEILGSVRPGELRLVQIGKLDFVLFVCETFLKSPQVSGKILSFGIDHSRLYLVFGMVNFCCEDVVVVVFGLLNDNELPVKRITVLSSNAPFVSDIVIDR